MESTPRSAYPLMLLGKMIQQDGNSNGLSSPSLGSQTISMASGAAVETSAAVEVGCVSSEAKVVLKKSDRKRKDPQTKINDHFRSSKSRKPQRNHQGFPIDQCVFEPTLKRWTFQPKGHGAVEGPHSVPWLLCEHCLLRPCIVREGVGEALDMLARENPLTPSCVLNWRAVDKAHDVLIDVFGRRYANKLGTPTCVMEDINCRFPPTRFPTLK